jgi:hypothetical protein
VLLSDVEPLLPKVPRSWIISGAILAVLVVCLGAYSCTRRHQAAVATVKAAVADASVVAHAAEAAKADAQVDVLIPKAAAANTRAQGRAKKVEQDLQHLAEVEQAPVEPDHELEQLRAVVAAQKQTIVDLIQQVADEQARAQLQADLAAAALKARDDWRATATDARAEIVQQQAVIAAQKGLIAAAYLKGGLYGFGAGLAAGKFK